ncbi:MAG: hypothetical protein N4A38_02815 [Candidatus Gracilibacteria bacterium]|nr:hypothetical protein [Candidatus Gracilibacteria bacterium]
MTIEKTSYNELQSSQPQGSLDKTVNELTAMGTSKEDIAFILNGVENNPQLATVVSEIMKNIYEKNFDTNIDSAISEGKISPEVGQRIREVKFQYICKQTSPQRLGRLLLDNSPFQEPYQLKILAQTVQNITNKKFDGVIKDFLKYCIGDNTKKLATAEKVFQRIQSSKSETDKNSPNVLLAEK